MITKHEDDDEKMDLDWGISEVEVKYLLAQKYENIIL